MIVTSEVLVRLWITTLERTGDGFTTVPDLALGDVSADTPVPSFLPGMLPLAARRDFGLGRPYAE